MMGQRPCRTGQYTLQAVARKITGLLPGVDVRHTDTNTIHQVSQFDRLNRANLNTLTTFDTGREKLLLVRRGFDRTRRSQAQSIAP